MVLIEERIWDNWAKCIFSFLEENERMKAHSVSSVYKIDLGVSVHSKNADTVISLPSVQHTKLQKALSN